MPYLSQMWSVATGVIASAVPAVLIRLGSHTGPACPFHPVCPGGTAAGAYDHVNSAANRLPN
jgi:hypothetical protein